MEENTADPVPLNISSSPYEGHRLKVPETDGPVLTTAGQKELVRVELHVSDGPGVAGQLADLLPRPEVPDLDDALALLPRTGDPLAVRTELDTVDLRGVAFVGEDAAFPPGVPQPQTGVRAAAAEEIPVGMEVDTLDSTLVTRQSSQQLGGLQVPDLDGSGLTASTDQLLGGAKPDALNTRVVTCSAVLVGSPLTLCVTL